MINASKKFKEKLKNGANVVNYAVFTLRDGTVLNMGPENFMIGGCQIEDKTSDGKFGVGFVIGKILNITIANHSGQFSKYDFYNSVIVLYAALSMDDGTVEKIRKGVYYTVVPETPGNIIKISATDAIHKLDEDYRSLLHYPATIKSILKDACLYCGIPIGLSINEFDNMNFLVKEKPEGKTYRQVVSYAAQIAGCNVRMDNDGYMQLVWYDTSLLDKYTNYYGGDFKTYPHETVVEGGNFKNYGSGITISGDLFTDKVPEHIFRTKSLNVSTDDIQITGVRVIGDDKKEAFFGENGYVIEVKDNPLVSGKEHQVADYLGGRMVGITFRTFSAEVLSNPLYEPFDMVMISDANGNVYYSLINYVSYTIGSYTKIACNAEEPARNESSYSSPFAQAVVEARRNTEKQLTNYDMAVQNMNQIASNAMGFHTTYEEHEDGSRITYLHDKQTLDESKTIYKQSIDGFFISTDGGQSYAAGFDKDGNAVVNMLYAIGIVADWIRSGKFEVRKNNKTVFLADVDTGEVRIVADSFSLSSGDTIESIAQDKASGAVDEFVTAVYDPKIESLQSQIDGQIETWYYDYEPLLSNPPASTWTTEAEKSKHEGDMFYWKSKGYSYRFLKDGTTWKWQIITDSDITKALSEAAAAQDTADNKRRVFIATPVPPYDAGDLWFGGSESDIMTCVKSRASGNYVVSDWQKRNKYIDQTDADTAASNAVNAQTQEDIFNRLTNNGTAKGIYMQDGQLYISFSYAKGGTLVLGGNENENGELIILDENKKEFGRINNSYVKFKDINTERGVLLQNGVFYATSGDTVLGRIGAYSIGTGIGTDNENMCLVTYGDFMGIGHRGTDQTLFGWNFIVNNGRNPGGYTEENLFYGNTRFSDNAIFSENIVFGNQPGEKAGSIDRVYSEEGGIRIDADGDGVVIIANNGLSAIVSYSDSVNLYRNLDMHNHSILNFSDERMKKNIKESAFHALDTICSIQTYEFDWVENGCHEDLSFIAQQMETVNKDFIDVNTRDGHYSTNQLKLIPYLVKSIQELSEKVDYLENEILRIKGEPEKKRRKKIKKWKPGNYTEEYKKSFVKKITESLPERMRSEDKCQ